MTWLTSFYFFPYKEEQKRKAIQLTFAYSTNTKLVFYFKLYFSYSWYTRNIFRGLVSLNYEAVMHKMQYCNVADE